MGTGNKLSLTDEEILQNLQGIQERNGQVISEGKSYLAEQTVGKRRKACYAPLGILR